MRLTRIYISLLFLSVINYAFAQEEPVVAPEIKVIGKVGEIKNEIRWAPNNSISWQLLNKYGYRVERVTTFRDGELLAQPEKQWMTGVLLPKPEQEWGFAYDKDTTDTYVAIAAQALFGASFMIGTNAQGAGGLAAIVNQVKEREARFTYALFGADQSAKVAELSGLSYIDIAIEKGARYLYRVHAMVPDSIEAIKTGKILLNTDDYRPLPEPWRLNAVYDKGQVRITWDWIMLSRVFNSYWVQRSDNNGKSYKDLTDVPFVQPSPNTPSPNMLFVDTLGSKEGEYLYRVKGKDAFGEWGPYSKPTKIAAYPIMELVPEIRVKEDESSGSIAITWNIDNDKTIGAYSLTLVRGVNDKIFEDTLQRNLPVRSGSFIDLGPQPSNYYKLGAVDKVGNINWSLVSFFQLVDSFPPAPPVGLIGEIDSVGRVNISWEQNLEADLLGYRVYRANELNGAYAQITKREIQETSFQDSISIKVLNRKVYYKILALDKRGNPSAMSLPYELTRPDIIPPSSPLIGKTRNTEKGPYLEWYPSTSTDVAFHLMYRKGPTEAEQWELIAEFEKPIGKQTFTDSLIVSTDKHYYLMIAVDESGLESLPTEPVALHKFDNKIREGVADFKIARSDEGLDLKWSPPIGGKYTIDIFRAVDDEPLRFFKRTSGENTSFIDKEVNDGKVYQYRVKLLYSDGGSSNYSNEVKMKF